VQSFSNVQEGYIRKGNLALLAIIRNEARMRENPLAGSSHESIALPMLTFLYKPVHPLRVYFSFCDLLTLPTLARDDPGSVIRRHRPRSQTLTKERK
jgi:hypothetical protein